MNLNRISILSRLMKESKGQALVFTSLIMVAFLGVTGIAVDAGKGYYAFQMLKASTNAAALAGAAGMPNTDTATTYANEYGSKIAAYNTNGFMKNVVTTPTFECLTSVTTNFYAPCENASGGGSGTVYNAIQVTQTAQVPTWIGPLFGMPTFNIRNTATASMKGGTPTPYNIAIVLDTTSSMNNPDNGTNNTANCSSKIACAELGIQTLLQGLVPGSSSSPIDQVALYVFPAATNLSADYACNSSSPNIVPYTVTSATSLSSPTSRPTNYALPSGDSYAVLGYSSGTAAWSQDYKAGAGSALSTTSNLVKAVGGKSGCGAKAPGGEGTYYAQVIYQAGVDLDAAHTANGNKNMMIILTDGDATACNTQSYPSNNCGGTAAKFQIEASNCPHISNANGTISNSAPCTGTYSGQPLNGTFCSHTNGTTYPSCTSVIDPAGYQSYTYPSALGMCGQAVIASQWVSSLADTVVYTLGYGSSNSGCSSDANYSATVSSTTYGANSWAKGDSPCQALGAMATGPTYFFSDNYQNLCQASDVNNAGITTLKGMFSRVLSNITAARLIPNSAS